MLQLIPKLLIIQGLFILAWMPLGYADLIKPLEKPKNLNDAKVRLGKQLFHDTLLSKDNTISCASCHLLAIGGTDRKRVSTGIQGRKGGINTPTVYNTGLLIRQFWDGRAETLEEQIDGPVQHPAEMGASWPRVVAKLYETKHYPKLFKTLYSDKKISRHNIKDAIAEFERSLVTINSPFDRFLRGNKSAISKKAKRGYQLFQDYGCASCHQGATVGGNMMQIFGVINSYFKKRGHITEADRGRFNVTGNTEDMHRFKVPSLRLAALTPPYLHDGTAKTLRQAVDIMFEFQLGLEAPDEDKEAIVHFIKSLVGEHEELKQ